MSIEAQVTREELDDILMKFVDSCIIDADEHNCIPADDLQTRFVLTCKELECNDEELPEQLVLTWVRICDKCTLNDEHTYNLLSLIDQVETSLSLSA